MPYTTSTPRCFHCGGSHSEAFCPLESQRRQREADDRARAAAASGGRSSGGGGSSSSSSYDGAAAGGALALAAVAVVVVAAAVATTVYITYKGIKYIFDKRNGENETNGLKAGALTAAFYGAVGLAGYGYHEYDLQLAKDYPAVSIYMDGAQNFLAGYSDTTEHADYWGSEKCSSQGNGNCRKVVSIPAKKSFCVAVAPNNARPENPWQETFYKIKDEDLSKFRVGCGLGSALRMTNGQCEIGRITYICNTVAMQKEMASMDKFNADMNASIEGTTPQLLALNHKNDNTVNVQAPVEISAQNKELPSAPVQKNEEEVSVPSPVVIDTPHQETPPVRREPTGFFVSRSVNLRYEPDEGLYPFGVATKKSCVTPTGNVSEDFSEVSIIDHGRETTGWVHADALEPSSFSGASCKGQVYMRATASGDNLPVYSSR